MTVTRLPPAIPSAPEPPPRSFARRRSVGDRSFATVAVLSGVSVLAILLLISWATTKEAWPIFQHHPSDFLFSKTWDPNSEKFGMLAFLFGTIVTSIIALVFAVPLSIGIPARQMLSLIATRSPESGPSAAPGIEHFQTQPFPGFSSPSGR